MVPEEEGDLRKKQDELVLMMKRKISTLADSFPLHAPVPGCEKNILE